MSTLKPYWKKHKWQRRIFITLCLMISPVLFPILYFVVKWAEFKEYCVLTYLDLWEGFKED